MSNVTSGYCALNFSSSSVVNVWSSSEAHTVRDTVSVVAAIKLATGSAASVLSAASVVSSAGAASSVAASVVSAGASSFAAPPQPVSIAATMERVSNDANNFFFIYLSSYFY